MELTFNVSWGYNTMYSRRQYHPAYCWDGCLECTGGRVIEVRRFEYPLTWLGSPVNSPRLAEPTGPEWRCTTRRREAGVRVKADVEEGASFIVHTRQGEFSFSADEVLTRGRLVFPVGGKYSHCTLIVTREGHLWFRPAPRPQEQAIEAAQFRGGRIVDWARMRQVWIAPGETVECDVDLPMVLDTGDRYWLIHFQAMTAGKSRACDPVDPARIPPQLGVCVCDDNPGARRVLDGKYAPEEPTADGYVPMEIRSEGELLASPARYYRQHDLVSQMLHDLWVEAPLDRLHPGRRTLQIANLHDELPLLIHRLTIRPCARRHLELCVPRWALVGREIIVRLRVLEEGASVRLEYDPRLFEGVDSADLEVSLPAGLHELRLRPLAAAVGAKITAHDEDRGSSSTAAVEAIYDLPPEEPEVKVGYDMTTVVHDDTGEMDWLLDYTSRTQLGNQVVFRPCHAIADDDPLWDRWGRFCATHGIHFQSLRGFQGRDLSDRYGGYFNGVGAHELSLCVYGMDPDGRSRDMKHAAERFTADMREAIGQQRDRGVPVSFGDASGGHRYSLLAGADFLRAETMVAHTTMLLSQARAAAQALGDGQWGVHIAMQHGKQPYLESHLNTYYLSLMQPWMMGANFLYEEDSLLLLSKDERQSWDDRLTKGKRDMTREFYRFAVAHPRAGRPRAPIAHLLGRYAAPFNGFTCDHEQDPSYSVWGKYGGEGATWSHGAPEKAFHLLDVLMPGAATLPLRQRFDRRRLFFSGSPYGDFDQAPIEADAAFLGRYDLLMLLGWNTMEADDYAKMRSYARAGGTLLVGVPQFSTHASREFLAEMADLALHADGDLADLCGVRVLGKGARYSGSWCAVGPEFADARCPDSSRAPSASADEDGPCHLAAADLCGAEPVIVDALTREPLLVSRQVGRGRVYLLTAWAYPGHEELSDLCGAVIADLCRRHVGDVRVEDGSGEVFWTHWPQADGCGKVMLLNTDWTTPANRKPVTLRLGPRRLPLNVREGDLSIVTYTSWCAIEPCCSEPHVEIKSCGPRSVRLKIHATGQQTFRVHTDADPLRVTAADRPVEAGLIGPGLWEFSLTFADSTRQIVDISG